MKRLIGLLFVAIMFGQSGSDTLVTVPQRYVSAEGLTHKSEPPQESGPEKWIGIGREIGIATKEGLSAVVDVSEKFGATNVGRFVMVMVAWRIIGKDAVRIVFGIPIFIIGLFIWIWSYRHFFFTHRVLVKRDKAAKIKEWKQVPAYEFSSGDAKVGCGIAHLGSMVAWVLLLFVIIF